MWILDVRVNINLSYNAYIRTLDILCFVFLLFYSSIVFGVLGFSIATETPTARTKLLVNVNIRGH